MKRVFAIVVCTCALPGTVLAATRSYETTAFESVAVSSGIDADISVGAARSVTAETMAENFDDLQISVEDNVLRISRPAGNWYSGWFGNRPRYQVHVVTPSLHALSASSGSDVKVRGNVAGDFVVKASSGSDVDLSGLTGGNVSASASSGSDLEISGSCVSLAAEASSGSDVEADNLRCENVVVRASSGSDVSVAATKQVTGKASSGSDISVRGRPPVVNVEKSSGADVTVRD